MKNKALEAKLGEEFEFMKRTEPLPGKGAYQRWGCECGEGWFELIRSLCGEIAAAYEKRSLIPDIKVMQVKQKFGRLRFYYSFEGEPEGVAAIDFLGGSLRFLPDEGADEQTKALRSEIAQAVKKHEQKSACVCEKCGGEGSLRKLPRNYYKTLCEGCYNELAKKP